MMKEERKKKRKKMRRIQVASLTLPGWRALLTANFLMSPSLGIDTVGSSGSEDASGLKLDQPWRNCMIPWGECIASIFKLLTILGCSDWDQVYCHLAKTRGGWTKPKLSGLAYLTQVPCPLLTKITKQDLVRAIVMNLRDHDMPSANALLQLSDGQICGDCDSSGEYDGSILFCDKCQEESESQDAKP